MADHEAPSAGLSLSNETYTVLRRVVEVVLPALGAFYATVALIWGLPYVEQVVGTITALTVLLATVLGLSRKAYAQTEAAAPPVTQFDGEVVLDTSDPEQSVIRLQPYPGALQEAVNRDQIVFKGLNSQ